MKPKQRIKIYKTYFQNFVIVEGSVLLWNKTEGLCGTLDGNPENDMRTKEGEIAPTKTVMIASWQLNKIGGGFLLKCFIIYKNSCSCCIIYKNI